MPGQPKWLEAVDLQRLAPPSATAYFFDVDGTLLNIKPQPEDVVADDDLRNLLLRLMSAANGALAFVSGRRIDDIDRIFKPLTFPSIGLHGMECRYPNGSLSRGDNPAIALVRPAIADFVAARSGLRLEDKGEAIAVHFRQAPEYGGEVGLFLESLAKGSDLSVQPGKMVAELKHRGSDKATGIATLLAVPPFFGRRPIFFGDDLTDESGFAFINAQGGHSVRIGDAGLTKALYHVPTPAALLSMLQRLVGDQRLGLVNEEGTWS
ncbi:MAG TPA: trehalose-phosphatase [Methylocella sp.]|nr:trehalose-phosphatase [Methylocella sp.]